MIYSDHRSELLAPMIARSNTPSFALSLSRQYEAGQDFTVKQLAAIRKWAA